MLKNLRNWIRKKKFRYSNYKANFEDSIKLFWFKRVHNIGDVLNYELVSNITDKKIEWVPRNYKYEFHMVIGSVLQLAHDKTIVWGSGLISERLAPIKTPKEILAVRGPLTRKRLKDLNIKCPEIYGDPALLMPNYYNPKIEKKYRLGIIPHYFDKDSDFLQQQFDDSVKIIDVEQKSPKDFIKEVLKCEKIISSSLHGIIIPDAYDVPALRVVFSNKITGGDFKFNDYFMSINRAITRPYIITKRTKIDDILQLNYNYYKNINLEPLIKSCPFM